MPTSVAKWLLFNLHTLKSDAMSPDFFPGGINDDSYPSSSAADQKLAVNMIYRCLKSGLIDIDPPDWRELYGLYSIEEFAQELARVDQFGGHRMEEAGHDQHLDDMKIWLGPLLHCTDAGESLVNRYFPEELNLEDEPRVARFNEVICQIFEDHGVPWSSGHHELNQVIAGAHR